MNSNLASAAMGKSSLWAVCYVCRKMVTALLFLVSMPYQDFSDDFVFLWVCVMCGCIANMVRFRIPLACGPYFPSPLYKKINCLSFPWSFTIRWVIWSIISENLSLWTCANSITQIPQKPACLHGFKYPNSAQARISTTEAFLQSHVSQASYKWHENWYKKLKSLGLRVSQY